MTVSIAPHVLFVLKEMPSLIGVGLGLKNLKAKHGEVSISDKENNKKI